MRIIVCGGRDYVDADKVASVLGAVEAENEKPPTLVHGGSRGADDLADRYARVHGWLIETHAANWPEGRRAGPLRNQRMVDTGADLLIAFPGGRGTEDCAKRAEKAGIPVRHVP
jgi:hypothetical protein